MVNTSSNHKFIGIIPARYASSRFPGKPLVDIGGELMIQRVCNRAKEVLEKVVVATDDRRIYDAVLEFGGEAVMTSENHTSGTDRCFEAYQKVGEGYSVIINIQGDEPFIHPSQIQILKDCFDVTDTQIATLVKPVNAGDSWEYLANPNHPKVTINKNNEALYFSRSIIPYVRNSEKENWLTAHTYYKHIGIYAYRADVLHEITSLPQSSLELAESLEQLRWLQNGYKIKVGITEVETIGIDTPDDLERAKVYLTNL
jgi:3-deoxy-manno-octulosonate cytidylyltransferase (CMP-KDO synthetase)